MSAKTKNGINFKIVRENISRFSIFMGLADDQLDRILELIATKEFKQDEEITREGEHGDELFLLLGGKVAVSKSMTLLTGESEVGSKDKSLIQLSAEQTPYFGEMAILNKDSLRSATVKAVQDCTVAIIHRRDLLRLCESDKQIGYTIFKNIAKHLAENLEKADQDILKLTTAFSLALQS